MLKLLMVTEEQMKESFFNSSSCFQIYQPCTCHDNQFLLTLKFCNTSGGLLLHL